MVLFISASFNSIMYSLILAFLTEQWMCYLASSITFLSNVATSVLRSMITKLVTEDEIGKVFSVLEFFKSVESLLCPLIYGKLYEHTLAFAPNAFLFLTMSCDIFVFISLLVINLAKRGKVLGIQVSKRRVQRETTRKLESASESAETRKKRDSLNESTRRHPVLEKRISSNAL